MTDQERDELLLRLDRRTERLETGVFQRTAQHSMFMPLPGFPDYVKHCERVVADGYQGFLLS